MRRIDKYNSYNVTIDTPPAPLIHLDFTSDVTVTDNVGKVTMSLKCLLFVYYTYCIRNTFCYLIGSNGYTHTLIAVNNQTGLKPCVCPILHNYYISPRIRIH